MLPIGALRERIATLFAEQMNLDIPAIETNLFDSGALDSLGFVQLLALLEQEFGLTVSLEDLQEENFRSIARIAELVAARAAQRGSVPSEGVRDGD